MTTRGNGGLDDELARLTNLLAVTDDVDAALREVAELARRVVPRCDSAALVVRDLDRARAVATANEAARVLAGYQHAQDDGPAVEALRYGEARRIDDMAAESRWPGFRAEARRQSVRSALALPLRMARDASGALTLYARRLTSSPASPTMSRCSSPNGVRWLSAMPTSTSPAAGSSTTCMRHWRAGPPSSRRRGSSWRGTGAPPSRPSTTFASSRSTPI